MRLVFNNDRDRDFFEICERVRKNHKQYRRIEDIACIAKDQQAESFYLTTKQITSIINIMRNKPYFIPKRKSQLYIDIFARYMDIRRQNPHLTISAIAKKIDEEPAPRFYLTYGTAKNLYYHLLKYGICNTL